MQRLRPGDEPEPQHTLARKCQCMLREAEQTIADPSSCSGPTWRGRTVMYAIWASLSMLWMAPIGADKRNVALLGAMLRKPASK